MKKYSIRNKASGLITNVWFSDFADETYYESNFGSPEEYDVEEIDITAEHALAEVIKNRVAEYPTPAEFMNAFFDGGESAIAELQAKRLAIKAKYPKP
jgi:hypothetical protein